MALLLAVAAGGLLRPALVQASESERLVKAAYLYHFCTLVNWPPASFPGSEAPLRVGIMGDDELADALQRVVSSRPRTARAIEVHKLKRARADLHLLFLADSLRAGLLNTLAPYKGQPVLTVTESENALERGSIINFVPVHGSLRFEVSQQAANEAGLAISSRLLSVSWNFTTASPKFR